MFKKNASNKGNISRGMRLEVAVCGKKRCQVFAKKK